MSEVRQRKTNTSDDPVPIVRRSTGASTKRSAFSLIEFARLIVFLFLSSCVLSWLVTRKDFFWGHRPSYTRLDVWKSWMSGPMQLTEAELKKYDGTNPDLPLYLAINGTIFEVSNGRNFYGPGKTYGHFSGVEGNRAWVTTCFDEAHITPDLRGVEAMFMPGDDPEIDSTYTSGELKALKEQERRFAKKKANEQLKHWVEFFGNSPKYTKVGTVKRPAGWLEKMPEPPPLCEKALGMRPVRKAKGAV